jgi:hypothetical protein
MLCYCYLRTLGSSFVPATLQEQRHCTATGDHSLAVETEGLEDTVIDRWVGCSDGLLSPVRTVCCYFEVIPDVALTA